MEDIRIGNDIPIEWRFFRPLAPGETVRQPYDLTGKNVRILITDAWNFRYEPDFVIDGNAVLFTFPGSEQKHCQPHTVTMVENDGLPGMHTFDKVTPFRLVAHQNTVRRCTIERPLSTFDIRPLVLESEARSKDGLSAYELALQQGFVGTLDEWLASLKGKDGTPGGTFYPTFSISDGMHLEVESEAALDDGRFDIDNGHLELNF